MEIIWQLSIAACLVSPTDPCRNTVLYIRPPFTDEQICKDYGDALAKAIAPLTPHMLAVPICIPSPADDEEEDRL